MAWCREAYVCDIYCTSVAFSVVLADTRVDCLVMLYVLEGYVQQYQWKIDNFQVLSF